MEINKLLENLENELTVFKNFRDVEEWLASTGRVINIFNYKTIINDGKNYIKTKLEKKLKEIELDLMAEDIKFRNVNFVGSEEFAGHTILGGAIGIALSALFAVEFFPLLLIGGVFGAVSGESKLKEKVKSALVDDSKSIARKIYEKLYPAMEEIQFQELLEYGFDDFETEDNIGEYCDSYDESDDSYDEYDQYEDYEENLSYEQEQIKKFLEKRGIKYLLHFTCVQNIDSINKYGILSVCELNNRNLRFCYNDENRIDNELDYISLSITNVNKYLLKNFINLGHLNDVRVIYIDASILYKEINIHRIYCDRNAAASSCKKGSNISDLENMFLPTLSYQTTSNYFEYDRWLDDREDNEPTDIQAEILFKNRIDPKYIVNITKWYE